MSTSDQQGHGPLTRKQLREIRLTGSTPVISEEEAAAAATAPAPPAPPLPRAAEPADIPPAPVAEAPAQGERLTRRQVREQERMRTASVPVIDEQQAGDEQADESETPSPAPQIEEPETAAAAEPETAETESETTENENADADAADAAPVESTSNVVTEVPRFAPAPAERPAAAADDDQHEAGEVVDLVPVSAASAAESVGEVVLEADDEAGADASAEQADADAPRDDAAAHLGLEESEDKDDEERHVVNPAFGQDVLEDRTTRTPASSFDEILTTGESAGSAGLAPSTLIFTPSPGEGSLSGPVASTGEVLITGSYELPEGLGSQGHAHGTADGKDVDAVLIDGELPAASSPTPIAASAAVSTSKSAGEVIRPPAPDKGNKLMLALAITAGGLALAVAVALAIAFFSNVLN